MRKRLAKAPLAKPSPSDEEPEPEPVQPRKRAAKALEEDAVIVKAKERKRLAAERAEAEAASTAAALHDVTHLKNLGVVEDFEVDLTPHATTDEVRTARWNPAWNGRNNFKKFRRAEGSVTMGVTRRMVQLVEYKGRSAAQGMDVRVAADVDYLFEVPLREEGKDDSFDDLGMEDTPLRETQMKGTRGGGTRVGRTRQTLFVVDEASDNDLGFDE
jgi:hypothetical protein